MMTSAVIKSFLIIIFLGTISCGSVPKESNLKKVEDSYKPVHPAEQITEDLEIAFYKKDPILIENIFAEWKKTVTPNTVEFINQNDTIAAIFEVFNLFYKPNDIHLLGVWEFDNDLNSNCKYILVQNKIFYSILNSNKINKVDWIKSRKSLLSNFRPPLTSDSINILYQTDEYEESFIDFLAYAAPRVIEEKGKYLEISDETQAKYELLKDYIPLRIGQKENIWHFETYPYVNRILFNKSITKAKIDFSVGSQFGMASLQKKGRNWIIIESKNESHLNGNIR